MTKIIINILRISSDSKYLEFNVECHKDYYFDTLNIYEYKEKNNNPVYLGEDFSSIFVDDTKTNWVARIPLDQLKGSSMYYVEFGISPRSGEGKDEDCTFVGVCSDITNVYKSLLNDLLDLRFSCTCDYKVSDNVKRIFAILYGHLEAMRLGRYTEAEWFYSLIESSFGNCPGDNKSFINDSRKPCNCH